MKKWRVDRADTFPNLQPISNRQTIGQLIQLYLSHSGEGFCTTQLFKEHK